MKKLVLAATLALGCATTAPATAGCIKGNYAGDPVCGHGINDRYSGSNRDARYRRYGYEPDYYGYYNGPHYLPLFPGLGALFGNPNKTHTKKINGVTYVDCGPTSAHRLVLPSERCDGPAAPPPTSYAAVGPISGHLVFQTRAADGCESAVDEYGNPGYLCPQR